MKTPIGRRIKFARELSGDSQQRLGALLDPPKAGTTIADIESGKTNVSWETVLQISKILEIDIDYFTDEYCPECHRSYEYRVESEDMVRDLEIRISTAAGGGQE